MARHHHLLSSLPALLLPLGMFSAPAAQAVGSYQRSYASARKEAASSSALTLWHGAKASSRPPQTVADAADLVITAAHRARELVIIDAAVPDKTVFYRGVKPGVDVVEIDASQSGLAQLKQALSRYQGLKALHIVSHAEDGVLLLGSSRVDAQAFEQDAETFAALRGALAEGADLLLYGCDTAQGQKGDELLDILHSGSGLDVAASSNKTGNAEQGGDWGLEVRRGDIETALAFSEKALKNFSAVLAPVTFQESSWTVVDDGFINQRFTPNGANNPGAGGFNAQVSQGGRTLTIDGEYNSIGVSNGYGIAFGFSEKSITLSFTDGAPFTPSTIEIYARHGDPVTFTTNNGGSVKDVLNNSVSRVLRD